MAKQANREGRGRTSQNQGAESAGTSRPGDNEGRANPSRPETLLRDLADPHRRRGTAQLLENALSYMPGVSDDPDFWAPIIKSLEAGAGCGATDPRGAARCTAVLERLRAQQIDIMKHLDKHERLDDGKPTERHEVREYRMEFDKRG